ncbi:hypothetical protein [Streptomyces sp. NPDC015125]|uniref:hypothetical protein n=1 Tax=Streptomyces sp. NPDC015125 TaxID=3364938 RepID=UPI0036F8FB00
MRTTAMVSAALAPTATPSSAMASTSMASTANPRLMTLPMGIQMLQSCLDPDHMVTVATAGLVLGVLPVLPPFRPVLPVLPPFRPVLRSCRRLGRSSGPAAVSAGPVSAAVSAAVKRCIRAVMPSGLT